MQRSPLSVNNGINRKLFVNDSVPNSMATLIIPQLETMAT